MNGITLSQAKAQSKWMVRQYAWSKAGLEEDVQLYDFSKAQLTRMVGKKVGKKAIEA